MGRLGIYLTDRKRIIVVSYASDLNSLLGHQTIKEKWFLNIPRELESFFMQYPEERRLFDKAFAYWVKCQVFSQNQSGKAYGILKRELKEFSFNLLSQVRHLIKKAVKSIKSFFDRKEKQVKKIQEAFERNKVPFPKKRSYQKKFLDQYS